ncbi:response regulator transcription factor [Rhabdobacter roseus]|uniref:DNA-binding CsgD family transcriptional regulator n=1 Tax=Rhabdobacter roseus TaxID=1655419 RepID=A0A840TRL7_9BACT|nr:response regulator transcription factor [Rhabdobacter roseus]MBB5282670.1 DNA-binding CsgD family transcriptional regulator [Rhabdobacter roseus]
MKAKRNRYALLLGYGLALGGLLSLMAWLKYRFLVADHATELYVLLVALLFTTVGIWVGLRFTAPVVSTAVVDTEAVSTAAPEANFQQKVPLEVPLAAPACRPQLELLDQYGISPREWEVLAQLSRGLSNEEIAEQLFVSTNTVKTHLSNLYVKLDVKRRTQAVERARSAGLIG